MENGPLTLGLEDGAIDVERLLVELQDEHLSVDSVMCFNEQISDNALNIEDVSCSSGGSNTDIAQEGKDILNGEVLNAMPSEVEVGYFQLDNDFCSIREEYLLGVEFVESITNSDYGSSEGLQASVSDCQMQADSDTAGKSDIFRTVDLPESQNGQFNVGCFDSSDTSSCHEHEIFVGENTLISPRSSCILQNIGKFQSSSSYSCLDNLSDENDGRFFPFLSDENGGRFSPASEVLCTPETEKIDEFELTRQDDVTNRFQGVEALAKKSVQTSFTDVLPMQKRLRKPTQRYIDELVDPISTYSRKRREVYSSTLKNKSLRVKDHRKSHMGQKAVPPPLEESSVIAIQVPFGSLANIECPKGHAYDMVQWVDSRNLMTKSKGKCVTLQNHNKMHKCRPAVNLKKMDHCATRQRKMDGCGTAAQLKKRDGHSTAASQKKRNDCFVAVIQKKKDDCVTVASQNNRDDGVTAVHQKRRDEYLTGYNAEEVIGRRKHHRLWTIAEVRKLIDGVSQYGVGRWSRIKKLFFSTSSHRTSVDLKDKWRNLLKASGMQEQGNKQGEKKRIVAWRPLPKPILRRVCELATIYPYPKGQGPKIARIHCDSPGRNTDITLSDYRRILRSINGN